MQSATRTFIYLIAVVSLLVGVSDLASQLKVGEELEWRMPVILLGFGVGVPVVLAAFPGLFEPDSSPVQGGEYFDTGIESSSGEGGSLE